MLLSGSALLSLFHRYLLYSMLWEIDSNFLLECHRTKFCTATGEGKFPVLSICGGSQKHLPSFAFSIKHFTVWTIFSACSFDQASPRKHVLHSKVLVWANSFNSREEYCGSLSDLIIMGLPNFDKGFLNSLMKLLPVRLSSLVTLTHLE